MTLCCLAQPQSTKAGRADRYGFRIREHMNIILEKLDNFLLYNKLVHGCRCRKKKSADQLLPVVDTPTSISTIFAIIGISTIFASSSVPMPTLQHFAALGQIRGCIQGAGFGIILEIPKCSEYLHNLKEIICTLH